MAYASKKPEHNVSLMEKYLYLLYLSSRSMVMHNTSKLQIAGTDAQQLPAYDWSGEHRRTSIERHSDIRTPGKRKVSLIQKIKMFIKPRLGVDRRKKVAERTLIVEPVLTPEEIEALIK